MAERSNFGIWLHDRRLRKKLTLDQLSNATGISISTLNRWEWQAKPRAGDKLPAVARALGVSNDEVERAYTGTIFVSELTIEELLDWNDDRVALSVESPGQFLDEVLEAYVMQDQNRFNQAWVSLAGCEVSALTTQLSSMVFTNEDSKTVESIRKLAYGSKPSSNLDESDRKAIRTLTFVLEQSADFVGENPDTTEERDRLRNLADEIRKLA